MGGASAFIWVMVVILGLAWALTQTGTVNLGVNFNLWVNLLLVLAVLGAVFNLFVVPFLGRSRTTSSSARTEGSSVGAPVGASGNGSGRSSARGAGGDGRRSPQRCRVAGGCAGDARPHHALADRQRREPDGGCSHHPASISDGLSDRRQIRQEGRGMPRPSWRLGLFSGIAARPLLVDRGSAFHPQ